MKSAHFCLYGLVLLLSQSLLYGQEKASLGPSGSKGHGVIADKAMVLDQYIRQALPLWKTPGISVVVVKDGEVVFEKGFGVVEAGRPGSFTAGTLGVCASTTKAMTALCMGMLVDEGKVQWTDKLHDVLPSFALSDPSVTSELTVRDLFTHNAGLGNADNLWVYGYAREDILQRMQALPMAYSLRSSFIYQNLMYIVAGELIHRLSGQTWEDFITRRLFTPVGMQHTYASFTRSKGEGSHENPHFLIGDSVRAIPFIEYGNVGPAGGVWSCAGDMGKWIRFLLDSARVNGLRLVKAATFQELFKPQAIVTEREFYPTQQLTHPHWTTYGLGWFQEDYRGQMVQFHTGSLDGAVAILGLMPSEHFGIYIFGNLDHSELRHALMYKAMDLWCFRDNSRDWSGEFHELYKNIKLEGKKREQEREAKRVMGTRPSLPLVSYAGNYTNEVYGDARVVYSGDSLSIEYPNDIRCRLQHWNYDSFVGTYDYFWWDKDLVQFFLDGEGKPAKFEKDGLVYKIKM